MAPPEAASGRAHSPPVRERVPEPVPERAVVAEVLLTVTLVPVVVGVVGPDGPEGSDGLEGPEGSDCANAAPPAARGRPTTRAAPARTRRTAMVRKAFSL